MTAPSSDRRAIITDALRKIDDLTARLAVAEKASTEPIAVVGMGCRLPGGVNGPAELWTLLLEGGDGVIEVPADRWDAEAYYSPDPGVPGTICTREGGFLTSWRPDEFDAEFFNIAPREAAAIDPQQRLLLEVTWEALENAGIDPQAIRGSKTGVFIGLTSNDYYHSVVSKLRREQIDAYIPFGNAPNFAAGRLSYFLGARGPALVLDTACSSSLVTIHLACESLRRRESDTALAGGVNLLLSPENSIACSRFGMLSPEGRCKTFDADANGYVRSEGAGVVVLKRLEDAQRDGDTVLAVIRGSAVNQDGASSGQTVPNGPAQQALMRQALESARLAPSEIDYIEAHGTGTALGDPIELDALAEVYGDRDGSAPLVVGSVKTNLGHLESAAGVTGFIKAVLSVGHAHVPRQLHFHALTPHAGPGASKFVVAAEPLDWPGVTRPRRAAVSSFGVSGTNAHVLIEQAPAVTAAEPAQPAARVATLVVSGRTDARIAATAQRLADWLEGDGADVGLAEVAHTLNHHRARYPRFATVCAADHASAVTALRGLAGGYPAPGLVAPHAGPCGAGTVFVYSGQGSQWAGMGRRLLAEEPAFAAAVAELEPVFKAKVGFSLQKILAEGEPVTGDARVQPVIMGLQLALTALWRSHGVVPDAVVGHSMGEVTAAVVAGALTPAQGFEVIAARSRLMAELAGPGAVALLEADEDTAASLIAGHPGVEIAGYLSPRQTVVAGPVQPIEALIDACTAADRFARRVNMEVASHTAAMDPVSPALTEALAALRPEPLTIPMISTVDPSAAPALDAAYWVANVRRPVRFAQAIAAAAADHATFVEISPNPILTHAVGHTLGDRHHHAIGTLVRDADDTVSFHTHLNATHTTTAPETPHHHTAAIAIPTTPWHHGRHWISLTPGADTGAPEGRPAAGDPADGWFLDLSWPVRNLPAADTPGSWLVISDGDQGEALAAQLGADSRALPESATDAGGEETLRAALSGMDYVVYAPHPQSGVDAGAAYRVFHAVRRLTAALAGMADAPRLVLLTRNAQPIEDGDRADAVQAVVWGIGRTVRLENPEFWGGLVDVDESTPAELLAGILRAEAAGAGDDDQAVHRRGLRHVARLERRSVPGVGIMRFESGRSHLVVGATGNIGPFLMRQLAEMGASTIVAVSRRGGAVTGELEAELAALGATIVDVAADAADEAAMAALFARFGDDLPPLDGVYLAALAGGEALVTEMTDLDVTTMFRPKVEAAAVLHRLTLTTPVRHFLLFSSIAGVLGSRFLGHYTAANTFQDTLAYTRRALGLAGTVVDWGLWKTWADAQPSTMAAGLRPMPNDVAIRMIPAALSPEAGVRSLVVAADWQRLSDAFGMRAPMPVLERVLAADSGDAAGFDTVAPPEFGTLLGAQAAVTGASPGGQRIWRAALQPGAKPYPGAHRVRGVHLVPVSVLLRTLAAAAPDTVLGDVRFEYPVVAESPRVIEVAAGGDSVTLSSAPGPNTPADRWTRHCSAHVVAQLPPAAPADTDGAPEFRWDPAAITDLQRAAGVDGQPFDWSVASCEPVPGGLRASVKLPDTPPGSGAAALIDAAVHLARLLDPSESLMLPASLDALAGSGEPESGDTVVEVRRRGRSADHLLVDVTAGVAGGETCVELRGLRFARVDAAVVIAEDAPAAAAIDVPDWSQMSADEIGGEMRIRLRAILARELGMPADAVDYDRPFPELGLDSMMAMTLLRDAKALVATELSATMLWNNPTLGAFAAHLAGLVTPQSEPEPEPLEEEDTDGSVSVLDALFDSVEGDAR